MSNFTCPHCGMQNIDCGKDGYKTPKEIEYEKKLKKIEEIIKHCLKQGSCFKCKFSESCENKDVSYGTKLTKYILRITKEDK